MPGKKLPVDSVTGNKRIVVTCEHAGNDIPARYRRLFHDDPKILTTHRAMDIGALACARRIAAVLQASLFFCATTRLLIDANRSLRNRKVFSEFSRRLPGADKEWLIRNVYRDYRNRVEQCIRARTQSKEIILHLSVHSFTPVLNGKKRNADIGLLYDPGRIEEKRISTSLQIELQRHSGLRVRRNYPYRGRSDGFTTALRRIYDSRRYLGLEIEFNQSLLDKDSRKSAAVADGFCRALLSSTGAGD
ncbi:MAG: N-formylglutamate amidohydrolase [Acidobacteria bacterium]|nr:N-formylglutamate amidohydrolase [Acidobacteriota bacterium]